MMDHILNDEIWKKIQAAQYSWQINQTELNEIKNITGLPVGVIQNINCLDGRREIGQCLFRQNKKSVARWIVKDWGGIRRGSNDTIDDWMFKLKQFDNESVEKFIHHYGVKRISSWSKILAFADPEKYAIYDSRTATALNCILFKKECDVQFYMPPSRNERVIFIQNNLKKYTKNKYYTILRYSEYIKYLDHFVSKRYFENKLEAEQKLFAFAVSDDLFDYLGITPPRPEQAGGGRCGGRSRARRDFPA
ncbi:MAG: hypothetical protein LCH47_07890 [Proteobacteria bacterium]|nr:hypothetical protein [Pseudomonadota bacterium]